MPAASSFPKNFIRAILAALAFASVSAQAGAPVVQRFAHLLERADGDDCKPYAMDMKLIGSLCQWIQDDEKTKHIECTSADCVANKASRYWCPKDRSDDNPLLVYQNRAACEKSIAAGE